ncbi:MAG: hypothetical protein ACRELD_15235 [Longimicrobiales bacterium]
MRWLRAALAPLAVASALAGWSPVRAQGTGAVESNECCLFLLLRVGAEAVSLGTAVSARASSESMWGNPAGLAPLDSGSFVLNHVTGTGVPIDGFTLLFTPERLGTVGLSYLLIDQGESVETDELGRPIGSFTVRDHVLVGSFAALLGRGFTGGINYKLYLERVVCHGATVSCTDFSASTHALDLGVRYEPPALPTLRLGATVQHLGFPLQVINARQADPPPARVRFGAGYELLHHVRRDAVFQLWLSAELMSRLDLRSSRGFVGAELLAERAIFLRAGYAGGTGLQSGPAVGVGMDYDRFTVAVAKSFTGSSLTPDEEPFQITFTIRF